METPSYGLATINEFYDSVEIIIPAKKNWAIIIFCCAWLCGWVFGEVTAVGTVFGIGGHAGIGLFMLVWLVGWTIGGVMVLRAIIWQLFGQEIITVGNGELSIAKKQDFFFKPKTFNLSDACDFRVQDNDNSYSMWGSRRSDPFNMKNGGVIWFDYGLKTVKFANGIDEAEAKYILKKLKDKKILSEANFAPRPYQ